MVARGPAGPFPLLDARSKWPPYGPPVNSAERNLRDWESRAENRGDGAARSPQRKLHRPETRAARASPKKKPPRCGGFEMLAVGAVNSEPVSKVAWIPCNRENNRDFLTAERPSRPTLTRSCQAKPTTPSHGPVNEQGIRLPASGNSALAFSESPHSFALRDHQTALARSSRQSLARWFGAR